MLSPAQEELLSAYLDGEISPEEEIYVQQLLEEKPEFKDRLRELSQVGESIRELPRVSAPIDFAESVLARVPGPAAAGTVSKAKPAKVASRLRVWSSSIVALAVLLAVGTLLMQRNSLDDHVANVEHLESDENDGIEFESNSFPPVAEEAPMMSMSGAPGTMDGMLALESASSRAGNFSGAEIAEAASGDGVTAIETKNLPRVVSLDRKKIREHLSSLGKSPTGGDQFSILTKEGEAPILVDFTVVDVQKTLGQLQVLLKNHSVEGVKVAEQVVDEKFAANQKLVAVYLDLEKPKLESVLNQVAALDATVIFEGRRPFAAESFSMTRFDDDVSGAEAASSEVENGLAKSGESKPEVAEPKLTFNQRAAGKRGAALARNSTTFQTQNYEFDLESLSLNGRKPYSRMGVVVDEPAVSQLSDMAESEPDAFQGANLPPSPELPKPLEDEAQANSRVVSGGMRSMNSDAVADVPATGTPAPASPSNSPVAKKKMKAVLILREGNRSSASE